MSAEALGSCALDKTWFSTGATRPKNRSDAMNCHEFGMVICIVLYCWTVVLFDVDIQDGSSLILDDTCYSCMFS